MEAADVDDPLPRRVKTCQRCTAPPASLTAGVPVTSSPTRSVPAPGVISLTTAHVPAARVRAHLLRRINTYLLRWITRKYEKAQRLEESHQGAG
jgi:hypothetical protein